MKFWAIVGSMGNSSHYPAMFLNDVPNPAIHPSGTVIMVNHMILICVELNITDAS